MLQTIPGRRIADVPLEVGSDVCRYIIPVPVRGFPATVLEIGADRRDGDGALRPEAGGRSPDVVLRLAPNSDVAGLDAVDCAECTGLAGLTGAVRAPVVDVLSCCDFCCARWRSCKLRL